MKINRTCSIEDIEILMSIDHLNETQLIDRIHDSVPRLERLRFSVVLKWESNNFFSPTEGIHGIVNYALIYKYIRAMNNSSTTDLLEKIVDDICKLALTNPKVTSVLVAIQRLDITENGKVVVTSEVIR